MSDLLLDTTRCPVCGTSLDGIECRHCDLLLRGATAAELWRVVDEIRRMERRRVNLVGRLRVETAAARHSLRAAASAPTAPVARAVPAATPVPAATRVPVAAAYAPPARPAAPARLAPTPPPPARPARPPRPRHEWTPQRVQNVILVTGVLVTLAAAIIFTAFQWGGLPLWARGTLMAGATVVTGYGARWVHRRGLTSSAEAIGALAVALGAVDAYAVHHVGLADVSGPAYWAFASAAVALGAAAFARVVPVRSVRYAAFAAAHLPVLITASSVDGWTPPQRMLLVGTQSAALLLASRRLGGTAAAARWSGAVHWLAAVSTTLLAGVDGAAGMAADDSLVRWASFALVPLAAVPLLWRGYRHVVAGLSTATLVAAALLPAYAGLDTVQLPAAVAAVGLLAVVAAALLPRDWRDGPLAVGGGTVAVALLTTVPAVTAALLAPFGWVGRVWSLDAGAGARDALAPAMAWNGTVVTLGVVFAAAASAAVVGVLVDRRVLRAAYVLAATSILLVPLGFAWSFPAALAWDVVVGAAALGAAVATKRLDAGIAGCIVLAVAAGWSLADDATTVAVSAALAVVFGAAAAFALREESSAVAATSGIGCVVATALWRGTPLDRTGFVVAVAAVALLAAASALRLRYAAFVALAAYALGLSLAGAGAGAGWLAWTLGIGAVAGAVAAVVDERAVVPASVLGLACATVTSYALDVPQARTGFVLAAASALLAVAAALPRLRSADAVAVTGYVIGLAVAAVDPGWSAWVLAAGTLAVALRAVLDERLVPVAAALGLVCTGVTAHAFGAEPALTGLVVATAAAALAVAALLPWLRSADAVSVAAYAAGLALAFEEPDRLAWALAAGAVAAAVRAAFDERLVPVAAALGLACVGMTSHALGAAPARSGLVVAVAASVVAVAGLLPRLRPADAVAAAAYATGLALTLDDPAHLAWALAAGTAAAVARAVADERLVPLAAALGLACAGVTSHASGAPVERSGFVLAAAAALLVAAAALPRLRNALAVAGVAYVTGAAYALPDVGWLAWTLGAGAAATALLAAREPVAAPFASALGIAFAGVASVALGAPVDRAAFVVTLAAAASVAAAWLLEDDSLEWVAAVAYGVALMMASTDAGWVSWVLAAGGVTALADALRPERRELAWAGGALLTCCSWVRLFLEEVHAPEAYAAPLAVTALVLGHLRRNRDESVSSWAAYGPGLSLAFGPSLWLVLTEPNLTRALLLAVAAAVVLLAGVGERLQAPLVIGATVLVVDAVVQVAPVAAALPKWATLGVLGILVTAVGVTYEDRRRDVQRLRETYESLR